MDKKRLKKLLRPPVLLTHNFSNHALCHIWLILNYSALLITFFRKNNLLEIPEIEQHMSENMFTTIWYKYSYFNNFKALTLSLKKITINYLKTAQVLKDLASAIIHLISSYQLALYALQFTLIKDQNRDYLWIDQPLYLYAKSGLSSVINLCRQLR